MSDELFFLDFPLFRARLRKEGHIKKWERSWKEGSRLARALDLQPSTYRLARERMKASHKEGKLWVRRA